MPRNKLPIGIQNFRQIREGGYGYVDKTPHILELTSIGKYFFLSRPRRFGKSLLVDTMRELFSCNEPLFETLFIHDQWNWSKPHPVLLISLGQGVLSSREDLDERLREVLNWHAKKQGVTFENTSIGGQFFELIEKTCLAKNAEVVVLVDEYDKPLLDNIADPETVRSIREGLRNFYSVIKDADAYIRFAFITGVSKFSKVSLFSGLNNLIDLTLDRRFATICGYTQSDVESVFAAYLDGVDLDVTPEETTNHGQIDLVLRFEDRVYVMEFKVVELTEAGGALDAIKARGYADKFAGRKGWLVGIEFSKKERNILRFEVEALGSHQK